MPAFQIHPCHTYLLPAKKFGLPLHLYDCGEPGRHCPFQTSNMKAIRLVRLLWEGYIPLDRSPPMSGTAPFPQRMSGASFDRKRCFAQRPNNSQKCLKNDLGEPKLPWSSEVVLRACQAIACPGRDVICYAANYYPPRSCLAGQETVLF